jgi:ubiquinone/menaquinone biosynthesis C-methylase UbiE
MKYNNESTYRLSHAKKDHGINYDIRYSGDNYNTRVWELEKEKLSKIINKYFDGKMVENYLDFACGTGRVCSFLEDKVNNSFGIDVADEMLRVAKEKCVKTKLIITDITKEKLDIDNNEFDLITAFRFFLNAENDLRKAALKNLRPFLKKEGVFIFNIHGNKKSLRHFATIWEKLLKKPPYRSELSYNEVEELLRKNGYKIKEVYGINFMLQSFSSLLPRMIWMKIEKAFQKIKFLNKFAINLIYVVGNDKTIQKI